MVKKITAIGNLAIDDIILYDQQKMYLDSIGGNALYSAVGARVWGSEPTIHARIGKNFPQSSIERLGKFGIKSDLVRVQNNDIRNWMLYEPGGSRQFINHLSSGSHHQMSITGSELVENNLKTDGVHLAPMPTDVQNSVLKTIQEYKGSKTVVSWDPHVDYLEQEEFNRLAFEMLRFVDVFLPSKEEVIKMFGSSNLKEAARAFADAGPKIVVIKKSIEGSLVYQKQLDKFFDVPIFPGETVEPTGAGDSFCGGFMSCFLETKDPVLSAAFGTVSASFVVEQVGAFSPLKSNFADKDERLEYVNTRITEL
ncbi:MAG: PfkB family carbohydrate kinase [Chloroflexota bacterium]